MSAMINSNSSAGLRGYFAGSAHTADGGIAANGTTAYSQARYGRRAVAWPPPEAWPVPSGEVVRRFTTHLSVEVTIDGKRTAWIGTASTTVVAPGELTEFTFEVPSKRPELRPLFDALGAHPLGVLVGYTDIAGQPFRSVAVLRDPREDNQWIVRQVFLFHGD